MLLIGSQAAFFHYPDFRRPNDWDIVGTPEEVTEFVKKNQDKILHHTLADKKLHLHLRGGKKLEIVFARPGTPIYDLLKDNENNTDLLMLSGTIFTIAKPSSLFILKKSHIHRPIHWRKNIEDYHFLKARGIIPSASEEILCRRLQEVVDERSKQNRINLNKSNDEFFKQSQEKLKRKFEHDDLHRATCHYDQPLFETLKEDQSKALVLEGKFNDLYFEDKVRLVREECFAIALERKVIPAMDAGLPVDANEAFMYALQRICTTLTKGWFREFALENYPVIKQNDRDFVSLFTEKLWNQGEVHV